LSLVLNIQYFHRNLEKYFFDKTLQKC